jgi:uncharacterized protein
MTIRRAPVREGLLSSPLDDLSTVTLLGSRCACCGETALGASAQCQNCGSTGLTMLPLSRQGVLWTYTVVRHKPPGDYRGPDPFVPFGLGLVELPEGIRVLAPLGTDVDTLYIGQLLTFRPTILEANESGELIAFEYVPAEPEQVVASHG